MGIPGGVLEEIPGEICMKISRKCLGEIFEGTTDILGRIFEKKNL